MLCNDRAAIPAIRDMRFFGYLAALVIPAKNKDLADEIRSVLGDPGLEISFVTRKNYETELLRLLREKDFTAGFIIAFPYLLPNTVTRSTARGFFNFHFGPLPAYRGSDPVFHQIKNREKKVVLTIHLVNEKLDGGPIVAEDQVKLEPGDTYGNILSRMGERCSLLAQNLVKIFGYTSTIPLREQDESSAIYYSRPVSNDVIIHWSEMDSLAIQALVNACNPWNKGAFSRMKDRIVRLLEVEILNQVTTENFMAGTIVSLNSSGLFIATSDRRIIDAKVIYCNEGFMSGNKLGQLGVKEGDRFE